MLRKCQWPSLNVMSDVSDYDDMVMRLHSVGTRPALSSQLAKIFANFLFRCNSLLRNINFEVFVRVNVKLPK